jgi:hypothetical protein
MNAERWTSALDEITANFNNDFGSLSREQLNWKPGRDRWSIAQNIDHLIVINNTYVPVIESVRNNTYKLPWLGNFDFVVKFFGNFILKSVQPDRKSRTKTFPTWQPDQGEIAADILERFSEHQETFKKLLRDSQDLVTRHVVISSPANKNIVYTLDRAFDIIVAHERRHLEQAREVYHLQLHDV